MVRAGGCEDVFGGRCRSVVPGEDGAEDQCERFVILAEDGGYVRSAAGGGVLGVVLMDSGEEPIFQFRRHFRENCFKPDFCLKALTRRAP